MRSFWTLQVCVAVAAIASATALNGGCSSSSGGPGTGGAGVGTDTDTGPDTDYGTCYMDDNCAFLATCCDVEACAHAHCEAACFDECGVFHDSNPSGGCEACLQMASCPKGEVGCRP